MTAALAAGIALILVPIAFNVAFALLGARFEYPDVLRRPTSEVLARFRAGGSALVTLWWAFAMTALAMVPLVVLVAAALTGASAAVLTAATVTGVLAGLVQTLGLLRWPFLVPHLARADEAASDDPVRREVVDLVFQSFHRYLGVAVGEHLGYLLTGTWTVLTGIALVQSPVGAGWLDPLGWLGMVVGAALALGSLEFVGRNEDRGWRLAERLTPVAYVVWSLWLVAVGVGLLV